MPRSTVGGIGFRCRLDDARQTHGHPNNCRPPLPMRKTALQNSGGRYSRLYLTPMAGSSLTGQVCQRTVTGGLELSVRHLEDCSWRVGVQSLSFGDGWLRGRREKNYTSFRLFSGWMRKKSATHKFSRLGLSAVGCCIGAPLPQNCWCGRCLWGKTTEKLPIPLGFSENKIR